MPTRRPLRLNLFSPGTPLLYELDSPSSPRSPLPPHRPRPNSPSVAVPPSSPLLSRLTPPPRLHHRSFIPTPPVERQPRKPLSWVWFCHVCGTRYDLGVTRRCIEDGHYFCSRSEVPPSPEQELEDNHVDAGGADGILELGLEIDGVGGMTAAGQAIEKMKIERRNRKKRRWRKKAARGCRAEFDYTGWARYNLWRREGGPKQRLTRSKTRAKLTGKRGAGTTSKVNCFHECDSPSECYYARLAAAESQILAQKEPEARGKEEEEEEDRKARMRKRVRGAQAAGPSPPLSTPLDQRTRDWEVSTNGGRVASNQERRVREAHLLLEMANVHSATIQHIEQRFQSPKLIHEMLPSADLGDEFGSVGLDCDGLGEDGYQLEYLKRRNKFAADGGSPSSPLKEEFASQEDEWGKTEGLAFDNDRL